MSEFQKNQQKFPRAGEGSYFDHSYVRYLKLKAGSGNIGFLVEKGMPRFKIYSNDPVEKEKGAITVKMNPHHMQVLKQIVFAVADKKIQNGITLDLTDHDFFGGQRSEVASVQVKLTVRRNEHSCVEMVIHAKKRAALTLDFAQKFDWHEFSGIDGAEVPAAIKSELNAKAIVSDWVALLENSQIAMHKPEHHEKKNGASRGNNNRNFKDNKGDFNKSNYQQQAKPAVTEESWSSNEVDMDSINEDIDF